jgi:hypothetical protein
MTAPGTATFASRLDLVSITLTFTAASLSDITFGTELVVGLYTTSDVGPR